MEWTVRMLKKKLGISKQRIHFYIHSGMLKAKMKYNRYIIDDKEARRFIALERRPAGRPAGSKNKKSKGENNAVEKAKKTVAKNVD